VADQLILWMTCARPLIIARSTGVIVLLTTTPHPSIIKKGRV
jgi:hypothetical protein